MTSIANRLFPGTLLAAAVFVLSGAEVQCGSAEARPSLADLQARIELLEGDRVAIIDSLGEPVGTWLGIEQVSGVRLPLVAFDLEGFPVFKVAVGTDSLKGDRERIRFATPDCSGPAFTECGQADAILRGVFQPEYPGGTTFVEDPDGTPQSVLRASQMFKNAQGCTQIDPPSLQAGLCPVIPVFVWDEEFTPPFELIIGGP
jgi:hypothetical protein